jgi:hypothetical protein
MVMVMVMVMVMGMMVVDHMSSVGRYCQHISQGYRHLSYSP